MKSFRAIVLLMTFALCVTLASIQAYSEPLLFAVSFMTPKVAKIDLQSGHGEFAADLSEAIKPYDLAISTNGEAMVFFGNSLASINLQSGAIGAHTLLPETLPGGEGAMAIRKDGMVFLAKSSNSTGTLFSFNTQTDQLNWITGENGLTPSMDGMAFSADGILHGLQQNQGGRFALYQINPETGQTSLVYTLPIDFPYNGGAVAGIAFGPDGQLWAALGNPEQSSLYRINLQSGTTVFIGDIGIPWISAIAFFEPAPGPLSIERSGNDALVSWPIAEGGILQIAPEVTGPWQDAAFEIIPLNGKMTATIPMLERQLFFRLRKSN